MISCSLFSTGWTGPSVRRPLEEPPESRISIAGRVGFLIDGGPCEVQVYPGLAQEEGPFDPDPAAVTDAHAKEDAFLGRIGYAKSLSACSGWLMVRQQSGAGTQKTPARGDS
jgi:hypothetical protein